MSWPMSMVPRRETCGCTLAQVSHRAGVLYGGRPARSPLPQNARGAAAQSVVGRLGGSGGGGRNRYRRRCAELYQFRHGNHLYPRKHQNQWWTCASGERDRGQRHHARHRQGAHPTIHHALNTRSTPLVPGWMALPEPGSNSERTGDCCDVCHFRKLTMLCIGRCISILWETRNSLIAAARERGESLEQPLFVGKDTYFIPHI